MDNQKLLEAAGVFVRFYGSLVALAKIDEESLDDHDIVMSVSGAGYSDYLRVGDFRALLEAVKAHAQKAQDQEG